ncbi:MAG TPA: diaminopimelate decarboxylase [Candidatus Limnocylindria bacterium]|nr:diaminopimelate decarboxylase [Candidatus Limnocylindria bacterium]
MNEPTALLIEAAERWGTPLYLTDLDRAAANARAWREALPGALVAYAVKANPDPALLRRLAGEEVGFEVVGAVELALAQRAGAPPERIVVSGVGQNDADLAAAAATGALVNAESLGALHALLGAGAPRIGLRINPALDAATHAHLATGAADAKFGIGLDELSAAMTAVTNSGARLESIGAHIGSAITDAAPFGLLAARLAELQTAWGVERIDLGGGFIGPVGDWASVVLPHLPDPGRLIVEPGRSVVADAGWLLTRVVRVQARGHVVVDAGMTELIRPMLYGARHPVAVLTGGDALPARDRWTVSGPVCEAGDVLARDSALPPDAGVGALLAVGQAGAYGVAMASNYNGRLRPAQAVLEGGGLRLSRRRETLEDLVARDLD